MKKLALASVAFAAISAFGAGDSFATGVTFTSLPSTASGWNDEAQWTPGSGGAPTVSTVMNNGASSGLFSVQTSVVSNRGVSVTAVQPNIFLAAGSSASLYNGAQHGASNSVHFGFKPNTSVLYGSTGNQVNIELSSKVQGVGFYLSPAVGTPGGTYFARIAIFGQTANSTNGFLGSQSFSAPIQTSCTANGCEFITATAGAGNAITSVNLLLSNTSDFESPMNFAIGPVDLNEAGGAQQPEPTPEPASLSVLGMALAGLAAMRRRRAALREVRGRWSPFGRWRVSELPDDVLPP